jgi:hypothetical protein
MSDFFSQLKAHQQSAPVPVTALAHELGIKVYQSAGLAATVSGKLVRDVERGGQSGYAIVVNATHVETRRRFTIAHEIAHFVLHRSDVGSGISENEFYRSTLSNAQEAEANRLAADILMPWPLIYQIIETEKVRADDFAYLAKKFNVSEAAMKIRLGLQY